ncbi:hypothetical protein [Rhodospirillum centenum]|uniref:hypothetical protein n=1 Tax=Rhodospirillum centenum TaxID=34018 RepID=UPI0011D179E9|nr:hypothetical protein [Rhodospirillum centenum]
MNSTHDKEYIGDILKMLGDPPTDDSQFLIECAIESLSDTSDFRVGYIAEQISRLENAAAELAKLFYECAQLLSSLPSNPKFDPEISDLELLTFDAEPHIVRLFALSGAAGRVRGAFVNSFGSGDPDRPDPGGRHGIKARAWGAPRQRFVEDLARVWTDNGKEISGHSEGAFAVFVRTVYGLATGDFDPAGIEHDIKRIAPVVRDESHVRKLVSERYIHLTLQASQLESEGCRSEAEFLLSRVDRLQRWFNDPNFPARRPSPAALPGRADTRLD